VLLAGVFIAGYAMWFNYEKKSRTALKSAKTASVGTPMIGGPFDLVDMDGKRVTDSDLIGHYLLVYFGFTNCPDVCPTELKKMERALQLIDERRIGPPVLPLFITIDPHRDTPDRFKAYAKEYHPRTVWLTGTDEQVSRAAKAYRIYWSVPPNASDQYLVDHSIFFFLMDRNGQFLTFFGTQHTPSKQQTDGRALHTPPLSSSVLMLCICCASGTVCCVLCARARAQVRIRRLRKWSSRWLSIWLRT
jgi:protein SCO1